ncbi:hypothetical protein [Halomonas halocynthiae]|uniref:hypothetical protein n=1 Tax=Halomonas halocynthiae TaxID=176290 RepID=UPI0004147A13|nr:hypothetical protein [Halomonas halocynthiae]
MTDYLYTRALTASGKRNDLAMRDGYFVPVDVVATSAKRIDPDGLVVLPPFVDDHIHLDKSFLGDAWWPYGNGDLLDRAMLIGYRSGFYSDQQLSTALDMVTLDSAKAPARKLLPTRPSIHSRFFQ